MENVEYERKKIKWGSGRERSDKGKEINNYFTLG